MSHIITHLLIGSILYLLTCFYIYSMLFDLDSGLLRDYSYKKQNSISLIVFISWLLICVIFSFKSINF